MVMQVDRLEHFYGVSTVCIDLGFCAKPFGHHVDPAPVLTWTVNLDQPPIQRCNELPT